MSALNLILPLAAILFLSRPHTPCAADGTRNVPTIFGANQEDAVKKDLKLLQGKWTLAALEVNGKDVPADALEGTVLTIKGTDYKVETKKKIVTVCTIKLDPGRDPKHFDMTFLEGANKDKLHKGIYRIDGDKFQLCRGLNPEQERPNQFATWPDTNYFVATWKRGVK